MRRVIPVFLLASSALAMVPVGRASTSDLSINGVGLVDYEKKQTLVPGSWVKYRVIGKSTSGEEADYVVTVLIPAVETFWGEDCFWVETQTVPTTGSPRSVATLMSYSVFEDSLPLVHMKLYMRKTISDYDYQGRPRQDLLKRPPMSLRSRRPNTDEIRWDSEKLGPDTVLTPRGVFKCEKVTFNQGVAATGDQGDSTVRTEQRDNRIMYRSDDVPITRLALEKIENLAVRKAWMIGRSENVGETLLERSLGEARLLDFGTGGISQVLPADMIERLKRQAAARTPAPRPPRKS